MCGTGAGRTQSGAVLPQAAARPGSPAPPRAEGPFLRGRPRRRDRTAELRALGPRDRRKGEEGERRREEGCPAAPRARRASLTEGAGARLSIRSSEEAGAGGGRSGSRYHRRQETNRASCAALRSLRMRRRRRAVRACADVRACAVWNRGSCGEGRARSGAAREGR